MPARSRSFSESELISMEKFDYRFEKDIIFIEFDE